MNWTNATAKEIYEELGGGLCGFCYKTTYNTEDHEWEESEDENTVWVLCCAIGDNGYSYIDGNKPKFYDDSLCPDILTNPNVIITDCDGCCGCGDW